MRENRLSQGWRRRLAIDASVVILLTLTGPFGTFVDLPAPLRLAYWTIAAGGCGLLMHVVVGAALAAPWLADWPRIPRIALGSMLAAVPGAALVGVLETIMRHNNSVFDHYLWFWVCVAGVGFPLSVFHYATFGSRPLKLPVGSEPDAPDIRFLHRLPLEMGRQIISLSMQDHYVRVTTDRGSVMILIRFSDAVRELIGHPGSQVHRSHWVAAGQAKQILHEKNRTMIELTDGRRLPVSRPYFHAARKLVSDNQDLRSM
jgi:LytTr DNA-binding domain